MFMVLGIFLQIGKGTNQLSAQNGRYIINVGYYQTRL